MTINTQVTKIEHLPLSLELMDTRLALLLGDARSSLAELKGTAESIPNKNILLSTLPIQEAKDSSEIENIITTHDDLFMAQAKMGSQNPAAKEVHNYIPAMLRGYETIKKKGYFRLDLLCAIQQELLANNAGIRKLPGTVLKNSGGETVYTPPQDEQEILSLLNNLLEYINTTQGDLDDLHPLVRMALIHHQFESIHPFYDGNGRTGRMICILYLIMAGLLDSPILYLSRYITHNKARYYELLQKVRLRQDAETWREWIAYILRATDTTARGTLETISKIKELMREQKDRLRKETKIYSQDLLNVLFQYPIITRKILTTELGISSPTTIKYVNELQKIGMLEEKRHQKEFYYVHRSLLQLLINAPNLRETEGKVGA